MLCVLLALELRMTQSISAYCHTLLESPDLATKCIPPGTGQARLVDDMAGRKPVWIDAPTRSDVLRMHKGAAKLPKLSALKDPVARQVTLERFAHHELQAAELFAWAILAFPDMPAGLRRGFLTTILEEQRHLGLYMDRLSALGSGLGQNKLSNYFWQHVPAIRAHARPLEAFLAAMGLTLEQANLDFSMLYRDAFLQAGDEESAAAMQVVHDDEIGHVKLAAVWLPRLSQKPLAQAYQDAVPFPLSAARAKGRRFEVGARKKAGLDDAFIAYVQGAKPYKAGHVPAAPVKREGPQRYVFANCGGEEGRGTPPKKAMAAIHSLGGALAACLATDVQVMDVQSAGHAMSAQVIAGGEAVHRALRAALGNPVHPVAQMWQPWSSADVSEAWPWFAAPAATKALAKQGVRQVGPKAAAQAAVHTKHFAQQVSKRAGLTPRDVRGRVAFLPPTLLRAPGTAQRVAGWAERAGGPWVLKPNLGSSGRGHVRLDDAAHVNFAAALGTLGRQGGAVLEPWLPRLSDQSVLCTVERGGGIVQQGSTTQVLTARGAVRGNVGRLDDAGVPRALCDRGFRGDAAAFDAHLEAAATAAARAAHEAGFWGPLGVDAFVYEGRAGPTLRPLVEINARVSGGLIAVMLVRRLAEQHALRARGAAPLRYWAFAVTGKAPAAHADVRAVHIPQTGLSVLASSTAAGMHAAVAPWEPCFAAALTRGGVSAT